MKTRIATLVVGLFCGMGLHADAADNATQKPVNFYLFSGQEKKISDELLAKTPEEFRNHPDLGKLPAGSPCKDCYEDVSKRQADARNFLANDSKETHFFKQQSLGAINYRDAGGWWREINPGLEMPVVPGEYHASRQPDPVTIDMNRKFAAIESDGYTIEFNKVLELFYLDNNRNMTPLGKPDWSNYTAGDDGVKVTDFYPGIDLEMIVYQGKLKTNIILNNKLSYTNGWLILKQQFNLPEGLTMDGSAAMKDARGKLKGEVPIVNENGDPVFAIQGSLVYDHNESSQSRMMASSDFNKSNQFFVYVPCSWLASPSLVYPVTIDPLVTASESVMQAAITGSGYTNTCYNGGCTYSMPSIAVPAASTVTDVTTTFSYSASNTCTLKDGGIILHYGSCRAPSNMAFLNGSDVAGIATLSASLVNYIQTCIPGPQCASYNMDFSMDFYRCQDNQAGCSSNCISANSPWVVTVEGHTVEINSITPDHIVCTGGNTSLTATANYGVAPYTYSWTPGGAGQTVSVSPPGNTVYVCTATDACGNMATGNSSVTVTGSAPPAVTITPNGTVCAGTNITFTATPDNGGSAPNYDWYIGSILQHSGPTNTYTTNVSSLDSISVQMTSNSTCASSPFASAGFVISSTPVTAITQTISSIPPYCTGQSVILSAVPTNGGGVPLYGWAIGLQLSNVFLWTTNNSFSYIVQPGTKIFRVWMVSSLACVTNDTVSSVTKTVAASAPATVSITLMQNPSGAFCLGTPVIFTTLTTGGGTAPSYEWFVNGTLVANSTAVYATSTLSNGDVVRVVLTSNATCVTSTTDTDSITVTAVPPVVPSVSISQVPGNPVCPGECVLFAATQVNGGVSPSFQWQVNGVNTGTTSNVYSSCSFANGDLVSTTMTANGCVSPPTASANSMVSVVFIDTTVALSGATLTSNESGASYQWLYCDSGMTAISGASGQSYNAVVNGFYAVQISQSGCTDTSGCYPVMNVGIPGVIGPESMLVYPNPVHETLAIRCESLSNGNYELAFFDVLGKVILSKRIVVCSKTMDAQFNLKDISPGIYFLRISSDSYRHIVRVTKQ